MGNLQSCCPFWSNKKPNLPTQPNPIERPKPSSPPLEADAVTSESKILNLKDWNWLPKQNGPLHHTQSYHLMESQSPQLVVRRGQQFQFKISTSRRYSPETHHISLVLSIADSTKVSFRNGTQIALNLSDKLCESGNGWSSLLTDVQDDEITIQICSSSNAIVGEWKIEIDIDCSGEKVSFTSPNNIFLLFNPWNVDDDVYMEEEEKREEYVVRDTGFVYRGTENRPRPCPWNFGQYEENVLKCSLYILQSVCKLIPAHRADPIKVVRAISAGVNSPDDSGVLVGNWSGKFEGGTKPTEWSESAKILQQFYDQRSPVKFGQCWVFSGVVTGVCRALGIPCRSITNYSSAHDTHDSLTIDYYVDDEGEIIEDMTADSVWNFHVWNECWFKRKDIGAEYDGWQVIDATPQEESDGQYRCGPTSLFAIKNGEIHKPYDVPFVFAEVNADKLFWKYEGRNVPTKLIGKLTRGIGMSISTKAVGSWKREDVTDDYKFREDSAEERETMREALRRCEHAFARYYLNQAVEDVRFSLKLLDDIKIGEPFTIRLECMNKAKEEREVSVKLRAHSMLYTGTKEHLIKSQEYTIKIDSLTTKEIELPVSFEDYYPHLVDQCSMKISCLASIKGTDYEYFADDDFRVRKPDIKIKPEGDFVLKQTTKCQISFTNPLSIGLKNAKMYIFATGANNVFKKLGAIEPNGLIEFDCEFIPVRLGEMTIIATFKSDQLTDVDGFFNTVVKDASGSEPTPQPIE